MILCETKVGKQNTFKRDLKNYDLINKCVKKGQGGILCAVKQNCGATSVLEVTTSKNSNILTVKISFNEISFRIVIVYGPQENESAEIKQEFFRDVEIEIECCKVNGDHLIVVGDLNAKIEYLQGKIMATSNSGKYLEEIIKNRNLEVLNFSDKCKGKWTHEVRTNKNKSVIDYVMVSETLKGATKEVIIDEELLYTPFRNVVSGKEVKAQYSDHNTIITKIEVIKESILNTPETNEVADSWIFNDEGWKKFKDITSEVPVGIDSNNVSQEEYNKLLQYIKSAMNSSFKTKSNKVKKVQDEMQKEEKSSYKVLRKYMKLGKVQRKVATEYLNMIKEEHMKSIERKRAEKVSYAVQELSQNDKFSQSAFWKLKKSLKLRTEVGTSVLMKNGVEVYGTAAIADAYKEEFKNRLRTRKIDNQLQEYENMTNLLCNMYCEEGKKSNEVKFTSNGLVKVIKTLSKKKAPGPDGLPSEIFINAGYELISAITTVFNNIKRDGVPKQWNKVHIKTLYKNKGSKKELENYRGIFLSQAFSKLMEKYIISESTAPIDNISKYQAGSRPNRSASDQLYLIGAVIDHAKYLKRTVYLVLYDFKQCFDSLWLEDCLVSLKNIGVNNELIAIIKDLNETAEIVVKTPVGNTTEFIVIKIVKQGTVIGPLLCSASTAECCVEHRSGGSSIGSTSIGSLAYVDDILDISDEVSEAEDAHQTVLNFTSKKRLELSGGKCHIVVINAKKRTEIPKLKVNGELITTESSAKYLGDIINSKGTMSDLVDDRVKKGNASVVNIFSIVQDVTFGAYTMESTLLLHNSLFLSSVLFNSQSWSRLTKKEMEKLKGCQISFLKRMMHAPRSTPNALTLCELGILPIEFEISSRKLMFLQHILKLDQTDPVKVVYIEQLKYEYEENWAQEVKKMRESINLDTDDDSISELSKSSWKTQVNNKIKAAALKKLNSDCERLKRVTRQYTELKTRDYLVKLPIGDARIAFAYRSGTLDIKCYRTYSYEDLKCRACGEGIENINHIVNQCKSQNSSSEELDIESEDINTIKSIVKRLKTFASHC